MDAARREDAALGALVGTFVGDAVGAPWEGMPTLPGRDAADRLTWQDDERALTYTDDTQLTLALAAHLLDHPDVEPEAFARTILAVFEPHRGYGAGMRALVHAWQQGTPVDRAATSVFADGSFGNGAAMRTAPIAVRHLDDPQRRREAARRQAMLTHVHPIGVDGAFVQTEAVALAALRARFGPEEAVLAGEAARTPAFAETLEELLPCHDAWADGTLDFPDVAARLGNAVVADRSVPAALWCAAVADDVAGAVGLALGLGGDVDTIAAMAAAIRGAADGLHGIPHAWLVRLEGGPRGLDHALDLARRLAAAGAHG